MTTLASPPTTTLDQVLQRLTAMERKVTYLEADLEVALTSNRRLAAENITLRKRVSELESANSSLRAENERLAAKTLTSATSSLPPSTDPLDQKAGRAYPARAQSEKKPGGQEGHLGGTLHRREVVDTTLTHRATSCKSCRLPLSGAPVRTETRQVIDVEVHEVVTDHVGEYLKCSCGTVNGPTFPLEASAPVAWGPGVNAASLSLYVGGMLPHREAVRMVEACLGVSPSFALLDSWRRDLARSLDAWDAAMVQILHAAPVLGADETGLSVAGKTKYVHTVVTNQLTRMHLGSRSSVSIAAGEILPGYQGVLVSDSYAGYDKVICGARQLCWAHLLRELQYGVEMLTADEGGTGETLTHLQALAREAIHAVKQEEVDPDLPTRFASLVLEALTPLEKRKLYPGSAGLKVRNLLVRLRDRQADLWHFTRELPEGVWVPATNNLSEQSFRKVKVRQRRSGCFRSEDAAREWIRISSYLDTCRKQGIDQDTALRRALAGDVVMPV